MKKKFSTCGENLWDGEFRELRLRNKDLEEVYQQVYSSTTKIDYAKAWDYLTFLRAGCSSVACECPTVIEEKHYEDIGAEFFHESFLSLEESKKWWPILWILSEGLGRRHGLKFW